MHLVKRHAGAQDLLEYCDGMESDIIDGCLYHRACNPFVEVYHLWPRLMEPLTRLGKLWGVAELARKPLLSFDTNILCPEAACWLGVGAPSYRELSEDTLLYETAPSLVVEVVTDQTASAVRELKLPIYARAGVLTLWLLNVAKRPFEVLVAHRGDWRVRELRHELDSITLHPFPYELRLVRFWDSNAQRSVRVAKQVGALAGAMRELASRGVPDRALLRLLLASLTVQPDEEPGELCVASQMLSSTNVIVRAYGLVLGRLSLDGALTLALDEIVAERALQSLRRYEAKALCSEYCSLLEQQGPASIQVREHRALAHAYARAELEEPWHLRGEQGSEPDASVAARFEAFERTGRGEEAIFSLVESGHGVQAAHPEDWDHALAEFVARCLGPHQTHDTQLLQLLRDLEALAAPQDRQEVDDSENDPAADSSAFNRARFHDIALFWRDYDTYVPSDEELQSHRFDEHGVPGNEETRRALLKMVERSARSGIDPDFSFDKVRERLGIKRE
ncbi:MAG: hypothetical protein JWN04_4771 [Myxococcaceae bacterium]|nr:hypothetical protein [Myxococcaceae bacterium]